MSHGNLWQFMPNRQFQINALGIGIRRNVREEMIAISTRVSIYNHVDTATMAFFACR
jgi:hypothetical protein